MATVSRLFDWRRVLVVVKPDTLVRWHRQGFRLFWRWKSKSPGRPPLPKNLQWLIREMASENPSFAPDGSKYLRSGRPARTPDPKQRWLTFIHNHARVIVASDFFVVVTATFILNPRFETGC